MRLPPGPLTLREALQYLALGRTRDETWVRRMIKRSQQRARACQICSVVVATFKRLMER